MKKTLDQTLCHDCARPYGDRHGFPDLVIPHDVWKRISPKKNEGGLLCPSCICARLARLKIRCFGAFMSGPIISVDEATMTALSQAKSLDNRVTLGEERIELLEVKYMPGHLKLSFRRKVQDQLAAMVPDDVLDEVRNMIRSRLSDRIENKSRIWASHGFYFVQLPTDAPKQLRKDWNKKAMRRAQLVDFFDALNRFKFTYRIPKPND